MFFSKPGIYKPCGIFTLGHLSLIVITGLLIIIALKHTVNSDNKQVKNIIQKSIVVLWILEIARIVFNFAIGNAKYVNEWVPLYYCSLLLYGGTLSTICKGKLKRMGDVFLATGAIVGGAVFMIMPTTTLPEYPLFHFLSIHSFIYHGTMVYLGLLVNITHYIELEKSDIVYYMILVGIVCIIAFVVNNIFDSNLMFISKNFPNTPIEIVYNLTGPFFTLIMELVQMILPFYGVYIIKDIINNRKNKNISNKILEPIKVKS